MLLLKADNASFSKWLTKATIYLENFWKLRETACHSIRKKTFTIYDTSAGWKVSSYVSSHWGCTGWTARLYLLSKGGGKRSHVHFNSLSSDKKTLETGKACISEEYFRNPSSMASTKSGEKWSQCNKAEILTKKVSKYTELEKDS